MRGRLAWLNATVVVSALGYFVDVYDLLLFSVVRVPSLVALGVPEAQLLDAGVLLLNAQMGGLLLGGVLWGVLGDRRGRVSVLFGSILLYSVATFANAFVTTIPQYAALRFFAGVGLAGELGAAITLVAEVLPAEQRGYGTALVAGVGVLGAVAASLVGTLLPWDVSYMVGGALGGVLLLARLSLAESGVFRASVAARGRGDLLLLLRAPRRAMRFVWGILAGVPTWYAIAILVTFSPELARPLGITGPVVAGLAVLWCYVGLSVGDFASGLVSARLKSRILTIVLFLAVFAVAMFGILLPRGLSPAQYYALCGLAGFGVGYWAVLLTTVAEQFGTNLRATTVTTTPNLIRGSVLPLTAAFGALAGPLGLVHSALAVGTATVLVALFAARSLEETYGRDLDFVET